LQAKLDVMFGEYEEEWEERLHVVSWIYAESVSIVSVFFDDGSVKMYHQNVIVNSNWLEFLEELMEVGIGNSNRSIAVLVLERMIQSRIIKLQEEAELDERELSADDDQSSKEILDSKLKVLGFEQTQLGFSKSSRKDIILRLQTSMLPSGLNPRDKRVFILVYVVHRAKNNMALRLQASADGVALVQETTETTPKLIKTTNDGSHSFTEIKSRFMSFKKHKYLENLERYQELAEAQAPKFLVISCADSRVCPSYILGFQPGEAFVVRNVANLVPPFENGPCETNAALEFSVTTLEVENILVTGHSCCGDIRALMGMEDEVNSSSFIKNWVVVGKAAKSTTKATASNLSFDQQCKHCEKESINNSLLNLLTYPWVEERVAKGLLSLHGGYYDFVNCTYEKWTLDYQMSNPKQETSGYAIKNREFWS
ncbi:hypothetical protein M8C21_016760, partial [Ambrosia artemisiifolia]